MSNGVIAPSALSTGVPPRPSTVASPVPTPASTATSSSQTPMQPSTPVPAIGKRELSPDRINGAPPAKKPLLEESQGTPRPMGVTNPVVSTAATPTVAAPSAPAPTAPAAAPAAPQPTAAAVAAPAPTPANATAGGAAGTKAPGMLPMGKGSGIDLRAEEEAARRAQRSAVGNIKFAGNASRARHTDLFGEVAMRNRLNQIAHNMTVDDDAMRYLALAAEARHQPPMSKEAAGRPAKALWSQRITSDPNAVMQALVTANKEENKAHRVARTERNARETEMARAAAAAREREEAAGGSAPSPAVETNSPDERPSPGGAGSGASSAGSKPKEPTFQAAPTFGAPPPKKTGKGKKAASRDVSADVQAKMTNIAASLATGRKKYAWQSGGSGAFRPQVPSLTSELTRRALLEDVGFIVAILVLQQLLIFLLLGLAVTVVPES
ncbi:hypothetical protein A1Q1_04174 [Trichosporon asahii var. asahii CBS 2479]|uniref:TBP-associated factor 4 n=1 Tax=Trichosporon asahii var. asahii (strain ATCC 90039 / CBS 2479 / JCM 2466 / KCTC 7840 / NBRC 103889/ NCYC 2677 / UAMH 7654) TaxID=1186058 RepID=J4U941_TRIAS|nr:hypothetical protein A1Q1_04174 [Trichosporon asahii var. asahii CBS 2479]EJT47100.1 hypothetical protein A1Q1_04174 [Trichosporon asahii var. asahii CBS 2479]